MASDAEGGKLTEIRMYEGVSKEGVWMEWGKGKGNCVCKLEGQERVG